MAKKSLQWGLYLLGFHKWGTRCLAGVQIWKISRIREGPEAKIRLFSQTPQLRRVYNCLAVKPGLEWKHSVTQKSDLSRATLEKATRSMPCPGARGRFLEIYWRKPEFHQSGVGARGTIGGMTRGLTRVKNKAISQNIKVMLEKQAADAELSWDQAHFEHLVAKWVVACNQPFTAVNQGEFREMLQYVHHHSPKPLQIPSDDSVKAHIEKMAKEMVEGLKAIFKIIAFVMDNATNNDTMVEAFEQRCGELNISFSQIKIYCFWKQLGRSPKMSARRPNQSRMKQPIKMQQPNLSLERQIMRLLGQTMLRKIVRHVRSSPQRRKRWQKEVEEVQKEANDAAWARGVQPIAQSGAALMLILDVKMRWSSTYQMLCRALGFRKVIFNCVAKDEELCEHELNQAEWVALKMVASWLEIFRVVTTWMSTTKQLMLSTTHAVFRGLQQHLKEAIEKLSESTDPALLTGLVDAHCKLSDYFTKFDKSRYYIADPQLSYEGLRCDFKDDTVLLEELESAKADLKLHFDIHYADSTESTGTTQEDPSAPGSPQKFDFFSRYNVQEGSNSTVNELSEYFD
ncbi:hypothetical protein B0H10DRAFT_1956747 [Mycena sp. CBHHK59/15]|nr:hypothetical protein B0H10DRAFT_1956747 [Mycena sp. CBHHK59/15]